jgi:hypothetical protein
MRNAYPRSDALEAQQARAQFCIQDDSIDPAFMLIRSIAHSC